MPSNTERKAYSIVINAFAQSGRPGEATEWGRAYATEGHGADPSILAFSRRYGSGPMLCRHRIIRWFHSCSRQLSSFSRLAQNCWRLLHGFNCSLILTSKPGPWHSSWFGGFIVNLSTRDVSTAPGEAFNTVMHGYARLGQVLMPLPVFRADGKEVMLRQPL